MIPYTHLTYSDPKDPYLKRNLIKAIEYATGRKRLEAALNEILQKDPSPADLWKLMRERLGITIAINRDKLAAIPKQGPLIFIANHPFGVVDGIIFGELINKIRPEFKFLVNEALCKEEKLNRYFLPIDFREGKEAIHTNLETRRLALEYLENGNAIAIFPAGGVSTAPKIWQKATDLEWKRFVSKLIRKAKADVVPMYFEGSNSFLFQALSSISMDLRVSLLLNEVRNKVGTTVKVTIGEVIGHESILKVAKEQDLLLYLRSVVYSLA